MAINASESTLVKQCEFCGRRFRPDPRVKDRQRACSDPACKRKRKQAAQRAWVARNPGYFKARYWAEKEAFRAAVDQIAAAEAADRRSGEKAESAPSAVLFVLIPSSMYAARIGPSRRLHLVLAITPRHLRRPVVKFSKGLDPADSS